MIIFLPSPFSFGQQSQRDPFISLVTEDGRLLTFKEKKSDELSLDGILYDPYGRASAMINAEIVQIGDWIGGYQVYKIESDKVILLKEGKELILKLEKEEEK
ncbi:MAG: hypothetical protein NC909_00575 [Candidatus Omnitrophica bacterium]|nr:hypothetical protein [Candidatus Omnitrophota bacterium]